MARSNKSGGVNSVWVGLHGGLGQNILFGETLFPCQQTSNLIIDNNYSNFCPAVHEIRRIFIFYERLMVLALTIPCHGPIFVVPAARRAVIANPSETGRVRDGFLR
jgi:hypothetical protein